MEYFETFLYDVANLLDACLTLYICFLVIKLLRRGIRLLDYKEQERKQQFLTKENHNESKENG